MHTLRTILSFCGVALLAGCSHAAPVPLQTNISSAQVNIRPGSIADSAIARYVEQPDPQASWTTVDTRPYAGGTEYEISVTSQVWHGITWTHRILLAVPAQTTAPGLVLLSLRAGSGNRRGPAGPERLAGATGVATAFIYGVPNEPLFNGLSEDLLLAYSLRNELATGDQTWPLFLPMTKAVVRSMDALQAFGVSRQLTFSRFIVEGHSKRGGTTWFAGAVDKRIVGIIPGGYDILNADAQVAHLASEPYISSPRVVLQAMGIWGARDTPSGKTLTALVDPYLYRDDLTLPKLVVIGTNDAYFDSGAAARYWPGLRGQKWLYCLPNGQHKDEEWSAGTDQAMASFVRAVAAGNAMPAVTGSVSRNDKLLEVTVNTTVPAVSADVWTAQSASGDFHKSVWTSSALQPRSGNAKAFCGDVPQGSGGYTGVFAAVTFADGTSRFELMTPTTIFDAHRRRE